MPKIGVVGSLVWDQIHGRDPLSPPVEEWGGIAYALGAPAIGWVGEAFGDEFAGCGGVLQRIGDAQV